MKIVSIREARAALADLVEHAQGETVILMRHGKPVATLQGTRGADLETVLASGDPHFWQDIERRRKEPSRPLAEVEADLARARTPARSSRAKVSRVARRRTATVRRAAG